MLHQKSGRARGGVPAKPLAVAAAAILAVGGVLGATAWHGRGSAPSPAAATDVLGRAPATGSLHLLAFLATEPDTAATASRAEAVEIVSLQTQYGSKGLTTQIVDESGASRDGLINTYYDWELGGVRLVPDPSHALAQQYHATAVPTVLVVDAAGTVLQRWAAYVPTVQIVEVIAGKLPG